VLPEAPLLAAIAFAGALIFGITGFGSALITIPLATHFVPLPMALALFAMVDMACSFSVGLENPKNAVRSEWHRLVPMILVGTVLGVTLLVNLPRRAGLALLGVFVLSYALYSLTRRVSTKTLRPGWGWVAGLVGGITSTVFGAGGPAYAIYLSHRGLTKEQFRATMGFATMTSIGLRVAAFLITGLLLDLRVWTALAFVIPAVLAGLYIASKVFRNLPRELLMRAVALLLIGSGASLLWRALSAM
jgi:uncharacterized membrane protein YfcA